MGMRAGSGARRPDKDDLLAWAKDLHTRDGLRRGESDQEDWRLRDAMFD